MEIFFENIVSITFVIEKRDFVAYLDSGHYCKNKERKEMREHESFVCKNLVVFQQLAVLADMIQREAQNHHNHVQADHSQDIVSNRLVLPSKTNSQRNPRQNDKSKSNVVYGVEDESSSLRFLRVFF